MSGLWEQELDLGFGMEDFVGEVHEFKVGAVQFHAIPCNSESRLSQKIP